MLPVECCCCPECVNGLVLGVGNFTEKTGQTNNSHTFASVPVVPSEFSGSMAMTAQHILGANGSIPFSPTWAITHGIYINGTDAENPQPWVIEISSSGIKAKLLPICDFEYGSTETEGNDVLEDRIGGTPKRVPSDFTATGWTTIGAASVTADFYSKSALFSKCGWAFNSNGNLADNTCYAANGDFYHYKITITADGEGNPTAATMAEVSHGSPEVRSDYVHLWVPTGSGSVGPFGFGGAGGSDAPVYVYYDDDVLQIFKYKNGTDPTTVSVRECVWINYYNDGCMYQGQLYGGPGTRSGRYGSESTSQEEGVYLSGESQPSNNAFAGRDRTLSASITNSPVYALGKIYDGYVSYERNDITYSGHHVNHTRGAAIPSGEREAFYTYAYTHTIEGQTASAHESGVAINFPNAQWYTPSHHICGGVPQEEWNISPCGNGAGYWIDSTGLQGGTGTASPISGAGFVDNAMTWNGSFEPVDLTIKCCDECQEITDYEGWCQDWIGAALPAHVESTSSDEITTVSHTQKLTLYRAGLGSTVLFNESETYEGGCGDDFKHPTCGNRWVSTDSGATRSLWALTDRISGLDLYSGDLNEGDLSGNGGTYPTTAGYINAWVGIPE